MKYKGITLIELLVTIGIIAILGSLIYPSLKHLLTEHHRKQAEQTLLMMAKNMEIYKIQNDSYAGATLTEIMPANLPNDKNYQYVIAELSDDSFQLVAKPLATQAQHDSECGTLTLNQLGVRGNNDASKSNHCWS